MGCRPSRDFGTLAHDFPPWTKPLSLEALCADLRCLSSQLEKGVIIMLTYKDSFSRIVSGLIEFLPVIA